MAMPGCPAGSNRSAQVAPVPTLMVAPCAAILLVTAVPAWAKTLAIGSMIAVLIWLWRQPESDN